MDSTKANNLKRLRFLGLLKRLRFLGPVGFFRHRVPRTSRVSYDQLGDEANPQFSYQQSFQELAELWEAETLLLSNADQAAQHPAHKVIVNMGDVAIPLILERMHTQGGLWFHALSAITGADPVAPEDRGNVAAMQEAWLKWGERHGYG